LKRKAVTKIVMAILLTSMFMVAFGSEPVKAEAASLLWNYAIGSRVYTVLTSPNNEYVIAGSDDRNVYCLDLDTGQKIWSYYTGDWSKRVAMSIYSVCVSPDNKYAIAGTANNTYSFNLGGGEKIWSHPTGETWSVSVTADSKYVIAGSHNGNIYKLNITDGTETWRYQAGRPVYRVSISSDNQYIAAGLMATTGLIVLDLDGNPVWDYNLYGEVGSLTISPDSKYVIAGSDGIGGDPEHERGRIYAFNLINGQQIWNYTATGPFYASNLPITSVFVSSDSRFVVAGTGNGITPYLDITNGQLIWEYDTGSYMWDAAISPNGEYVIAASIGEYYPFPEAPPNVFLLKTSDGSKIWNYSTPATSISISPNSETIVAGSWYGNVYAFESPSPTPLVVSAEAHIDPCTLNLKSKGQWITAYIQPPEGYNPADIDASSILLNGTIPPVLDPKYGFVTNQNEYLIDHNNDGILERMIKFDRAKIASWIGQSVGTQRYISLTIAGELTDKTQFEGTCTIFAL
jgi:outer membrane protein assembly factor BamB